MLAALGGMYIGSQALLDPSINTYYLIYYYVSIEAQVEWVLVRSSPRPK